MSRRKERPGLKLPSNKLTSNLLFNVINLKKNWESKADWLVPNGENEGQKQNRG